MQPAQPVQRPRGTMAPSVLETSEGGWLEPSRRRRGRVCRAMCISGQMTWALTPGRWQPWRAVGSRGAEPHSGLTGALWWLLQGHR